MKGSLVFRSFRVHLSQVMTSANYWIAVLLLFTVLFAEIVEGAFSLPWQVQSSFGMGSADYFNMSLHFGYYIYAAPLACAFAASNLLINDVEAGFFRHKLIHGGRREYPCGLFLGTTVGGGFALMTSVLLFAVLCSLVYAPTEDPTTIAAMDGWLPLLTSPYGHWRYMLAHAFLSLLFGMVWAGIGLTISVFSANRYVCYVSPFIICFGSVLALPINMQPLEMLVQMNWTSFSFSKLIAYQSFLYISVFIWFRYVFERRIVCEQG